MGETTDQIKQEIEEARNRLGEDLNALEYHVRRQMDWRAHFDRRPWVFVAGVFIAALLLSRIIAARS